MAAPAKVESIHKLSEEELVEQLKKQHGVSKVHVFSASGHTVLVRMPATAVWRRFRSEMNDVRRRDDAGERLLRSCLLHPDQAGFDAMVEDQPGLLDTFANELAEVAGLAKSVEKKVL